MRKLKLSSKFALKLIKMIRADVPRSVIASEFEHFPEIEQAIKDGKYMIRDFEGFTLEY